MQVYSGIQWAAGMQGSSSAQCNAQSSVEDGQVPVCQSASHGDEDQQCKASQPDEVPVLVSGAGHDSLAMAELTQASAVYCCCCCCLAESMTKKVDCQLHDCTALVAGCSVDLGPIAKVLTLA